ncbi:hypothetical protein [Thermovibrio sp.]
MKIEVKPSLFFESSQLKHESVVDALFFFAERVKRLKLRVDAIFPAEPFALPLAMLLSDRLSVPIKGESFLKEEERVLLLFSFCPFEEISPRFIYDRVKLFREEYPFSPSLLVASPKLEGGVDFQLLKAPLGRLYSYRFLREARRNFFWPVKGEVNHISQELWELAKLEAKNLLRAKRIRDSAKRYLKEEELTRLKIVDSDVELALWERFEKGVLTPPELPKEEEEIGFKPEKLFQVEDKTLSSAITSLLEFVAQSLEYHFPTTLAYSNYEILEKDGVLIIPKVKEELSGADLLVEFSLKSKKEKDFEKLFLTVKKALREVESSLLKGAFKPQFEWTADKELGRFTLYLSWFLDREMALKLYRRINKEWLVSRLLARKRVKGELLELLKFLREFEFNLENLLTLKSKLSSLWAKNNKLFELKRNKLKELIEEKELWPLIGYPCAGTDALPKELCRFLMNLKGFSSPHQLLAESSTYWSPVITKRSLRPDWERVIKRKEGFSLKAEPLNPNSPVTYVIQTEEGKLLGHLPKVISHYLAAKERSGKKLAVRELYFEPDVFTENSYWVEIKCL